MIIKAITKEESIQENLDTWCFEVGSRFEQIGVDAAHEFMKTWSILNKDFFPSIKNKDIQVVDLGCGDGASSIELAKFGFNVFAVDINLKKLSNISFPNITKINLDMKKFLESMLLPVDNIFTHHSLEHTVDVKEIIDLCGKKLKIGGLYYATVPSSDYLHSVHHVVFEDALELLPEGLQLLFAGERERFGEKEYICLATKT